MPQKRIYFSPWPEVYMRQENGPCFHMILIYKKNKFFLSKSIDIPA